MGSSTSSISTPQPTYSGVSAAPVDSATIHVPANKTAYGSANSNTFSKENIHNSSSASVPPISQHGPSAYSSAQVPGSNNISHGNPGGPPYPQYSATVPGKEGFHCLNVCQFSLLYYVNIPIEIFDFSFQTQYPGMKIAIRIGKENLW
jgi:hypothetical protein